MPFKLEPNRNYAYLFFIIAAIVILSVFITRGKLTGLIFSLCFYYLGFIQLYSGVALSRSWTAAYKKEDHPIIFWIMVILMFVAGTSTLTMFLPNLVLGIREFTNP